MVNSLRLKGEPKDGVSIAIRGPVTLQSAFSVEPVSITSTQITKSVNGEGDGSKKSADTMGMKHRVDKAVYVAYGAMTPQLAERTGFSDEDASVIKDILPTLFEGDASSARPEGSMAVEKSSGGSITQNPGNTHPLKSIALYRSREMAAMNSISWKD